MRPLLRATRAQTARLERIPDVAAPRGAAPRILRRGLPLAFRTADPPLVEVELVENLLVRCDDEGQEGHASDRVAQ